MFVNLLLILIVASPKAIETITSLVHNLDRCWIDNVSRRNYTRRWVDVGEVWIFQAAQSWSRNWTIILRLFLSWFRKGWRVLLFVQFHGTLIGCDGWKILKVGKNVWKIVGEILLSILSCSQSSGGADCGCSCGSNRAGGSDGVETFISLWGRTIFATSPSRTFCVTVKVLPVSNGTVQKTGSGERMITICSGDLTRVGSGGDLTICSMTSGCWIDGTSTSSTENRFKIATVMESFLGRLGTTRKIIFKVEKGGITASWETFLAIYWKLWWI